MALPARPVSKVLQTCDDYSSGAVTAGTNKREWTALFDGHVVAHARAEGAGAGAGNTDVDVNVEGTTVLSRILRIATGSTGEFTQGEPAASRFVRAGQRISYDIDAIPATSGHTRFSISIAIVAP